jgi:ATP-binding cassette subfamily C protein
MISGTIEENIALGVSNKEVDKAQLSKAIDQAHLKEVIQQLEAGHLTDLGNRKDQLSGGQLQRIGLARALYSQPGLLVLDEATSALDAKSENEITRVLEEMKGKVTVLLIAHRLNSLRNADVVYYIENGRFEASGNLADLVQNNKKVQKLAEMMSVNGSA